ncbi:MAG: hypothetical protein ACXW32_02665 [Limisphaerales bacterium]
MPYLIAILVSALVLCGSACKSSSGEGASGTAPAKSNRTISAKNIPPAGEANQPAVRPVNVLAGRVIAVRAPLRFVIIDFAGGRMPQLDQKLFLYRLDQKVAEVKISGPYLGTTVAADITAGDALEGDLVRDR